MYEELKKIMQEHPGCRERKNKNRFIARLLLSKNPTLNIGMDKLADIIADGHSYDRAWRKVLQDCPELRGKDYGEKEELVDKQLEILGYNGVNR